MSSFFATSGSGIHLSVALGDRKCRSCNVLLQRAVPDTPRLRKIHTWAWFGSCKRTDLRLMMENDAIQQPLPSSSFGLCGTVAVSNGRSLWQHQRAFQVYW